MPKGIISALFQRSGENKMFYLKNRSQKYNTRVTAVSRKKLSWENKLATDWLKASFFSLDKLM